MISLDNLNAAHHDCSLHRPLIEKSKVVRCFYCRNAVTPETIERWIDEGQTALCPICGIDAVLPDSVDLSDEFIQAMHDYWFTPIRPRKP